MQSNTHSTIFSIRSSIVKLVTIEADWISLFHHIINLYHPTLYLSFLSTPTRITLCSIHYSTTTPSHIFTPLQSTPITSGTPSQQTPHISILHSVDPTISSLPQCYTPTFLSPKAATASFWYTGGSRYNLWFPNQHFGHIKKADLKISKSDSLLDIENIIDGYFLLRSIISTSLGLALERINETLSFLVQRSNREWNEMDENQLKYYLIRDGKIWMSR